MDREQVKRNSLVAAGLLALTGTVLMYIGYTTEPTTITELRNVVVGVGIIALSLFVLKAGEIYNQ